MVRTPCGWPRPTAKLAAWGCPTTGQSRRRRGSYPSIAPFRSPCAAIAVLTNRDSHGCSHDSAIRSLACRCQQQQCGFPIAACRKCTCRSAAPVEPPVPHRRTIPERALAQRHRPAIPPVGINKLFEPSARPCRGDERNRGRTIDQRAANPARPRRPRHAHLLTRPPATARRDPPSCDSRLRLQALHLRSRRSKVPRIDCPMVRTALPPVELNADLAICEPGFAVTHAQSAPSLRSVPGSRRAANPAPPIARCRAVDRVRQDASDPRRRAPGAGTISMIW